MLLLYFINIENIDPISIILDSLDNLIYLPFIAILFTSSRTSCRWFLSKPKMACLARPSSIYLKPARTCSGRWTSRLAKSNRHTPIYFLKNDWLIKITIYEKWVSYHYKRVTYKSETLKILFKIKIITLDEGEFPFYTSTC